jgi:hypothetical protein
MNGQIDKVQNTEKWLISTDPDSPDLQKKTNFPSERKFERRNNRLQNQHKNPRAEARAHIPVYIGIMAAGI